MIVIAHAGHWLVSLAYVAPLAVLAGIVVAGKLSDRRAERQAQPGAQESQENTTAGRAGAKEVQ